MTVCRAGWYLPGGGDVLVTEFRGMALNGLFCATATRSRPPHWLYQLIPRWCTVCMRREVTDVCSRVGWSRRSRRHIEYTALQWRRQDSDSVQSPCDNWCYRCEHSRMGYTPPTNCSTRPVSHNNNNNNLIINRIASITSEALAAGRISVQWKPE